MTDSKNPDIILIVDDNPTNLEVLFDTLSNGGFEVAVAIDGEKAIKQSEYYPPDLILLDVVMPGIDGFETCKRLKENPLTNDIPVIFMTSLSDTADRVKGFNVGAVDYITKPFQQEEVLARVNVHLKLRSLTKELEKRNVLLKQEISDRIAAQTALQELNKELEQRVQERTTDLSQVLHEIRELFQELQDNESRLTQFLEAMPVAIFIVDSSGKPFYTNRIAQQLLGKGVIPDATIEELAETYQVYIAGTSQQYPSDRMPVVRALNGESVTVYDLEIHQPDKIIPIEVWASPIYDRTRKIAYSIAAFQDITERKKAEAERQRFTNELFQLNKAYERFVPNQFLHFLEKPSIVDVELGDQVQLEMSVLFSDIRDFTTLSESMTPEDNFQFINAYLSRMESAIIENHGFIDKYIGDAIMALFSGNADNAINASIAMLHQLQVYNQERVNSGYAPIKIGIGINTGNLMLGTVGGQNRMDTTVISDAVNLASRVEGLTKTYGIALLITEQTFNKLANPSNYAMRMIAQVSVKGKVNLSTIYEVFEADIPETKRGKLTTKNLFDRGLSLYRQQKFIEATEFFVQCLSFCPSDQVAQIYLDWCEQKTLTLNIDLLERSLALIKPQSDEFVSNFYEILFKDSSQIKSLFMNTKMAQQKEKLWQSLEIIIENLRKPQLINVFAKGLGATHAKYGVSVEHYPVVANALIQALKAQMGLEWTPKTEKAWVEAYTIIQSAMIDGMAAM
ncbi:response regulator [Microcoleus sp. S13C4]|uniref:response regulator n=1 Tax=Microcoleus sp. S13C4 TaxID=3055410 RepID=UPI002FCFC384